MIILYYVLGSLFSTYLLWIFYLAVMNLARAKREGKLNGFAKLLGTPVLFIGLLLDTFVNVFVMTLVLLEIPEETLVSDRLSRHYTQDTWRGAFARKFAELLLDPFDPSGKHLD